MSDVDLTPVDITKTKTFEVERMTPQEAAENLDMVGHDFYLFADSETGNVEVVYRRKDGQIGLLIPEVED